MEQTLLLASPRYYAAHRSLLRIWNARSRLSASHRIVTLSAPPNAPQNCFVAPDFARWEWQTIMPSILEPQRWRTAPRVCPRNKSCPSELENPTLTRRVSSPCSMEKKSLLWQSATLGPTQAVKWLRHQIALV